MDRLFNFSLLDNRIKVDYRYNLGHEFGDCCISPDNRYNFIFISKNASSEVKFLLSSWKKTNYFQIDHTVKNLVLLRDPTERWISGIAEFLIGRCSYLGLLNQDSSLEEIERLLDSKIFQNILFHFAIFDGHTIPQVCYLNGIDLDSTEFFFLDESGVSRLANYIGMPYTPKRINSIDNDFRKKLISQKLKILIESNPDYQKSIDVHFYADHQLFDCVKLYQ